MISLTPRQADALRFIAGFLRANGYSPTFEEVAAGLGLASKGAAFNLVESLSERGAVKIRRSKRNKITLLEPVLVPRAPDGAPLFFVRIGESAR